MTRTITTAAELDARPVGSVVMCDDEHGVAKRVDADIYDGYDWIVVGSDEYRETHEMTWMLPATVLHDPSAPAPAPSVVPEAAVEARAVLLHHYLSDETDEDSLTGAARLAWEQVDGQRREFVRGIVRRFLVDDGTAAPSATREDPLREALNAYRAEVDRAKASSMSHALLMLAGATLANAVEAAITPKEDR